MNNIIHTLPTELIETLPAPRSLTFQGNGHLWTWAPDMGLVDFLREFPDHKMVSGLLDCSGHSWCSKAFLFWVADCFDPPVYVQFGSSFEDAHESFLDNEPSLLIAPEDMKDYGTPEEPMCHFTSDGKPIDTDNVQGAHDELKLVAWTFPRR